MQIEKQANSYSRHIFYLYFIHILSTSSLIIINKANFSQNVGYNDELKDKSPLKVWLDAAVLATLGSVNHLITLQAEIKSQVPRVFFTSILS